MRNVLNFRRQVNSASFGFKNVNSKFPPGKVLTIIAVLVLLVVSYIVGGKSSQNVSGAQDQRVDAPRSRAKQLINKEFLLPLKDDKNKEIEKIKYFIEAAELQDEILVKGQRATAVKGRTFLILNIKITNKYTKTIALSSKDYIRLIVDDKKELIAPDIHNDPVQIQAISTKYTRLGFPINENYKSLKLQIGEVEGKKETINLNFK